MAGDEPFKRYEQAGAAFFESAVNRLNGFFRGGSGPGGQESGPDGEGGARHERTEQLFETIRSEIRSQLTQLGLATREDIAGVRSRLDALESRLDDLESRLGSGGSAGVDSAGGSEDRGEAEQGGPTS